MTKKKKKEFRFFWEEPFDAAERGMKKTRKKMDNLFPFEFKFTIPRINIPEIRTPINMAQTQTAIILRAELPGFKKDEIELAVTDSTIEIRAIKKRDSIEKTNKMFRQEKSAKSISRAFTLPQNIDPDRTEAKLEDGLLTVIMPKQHPEKKKKRRIEIR
jgi:HSP20 family protein